MTRDWKISLSVAILLHVGLLYAFKYVLPHPARLTRDTVLEITMIAADEATPIETPTMTVAPPPASVVEIPPAPSPTIEPKEAVAPTPVKSSLPVPLPHDLAKAVEPTRPPSLTRLVEQPVNMVVRAPAPPSTIVGDGSSTKPGADVTTKLAGVGVPAKPKYLKNPEPSYPPSARRRRQEGSVLLEVKVSAAGRTTSVTLKRSSGYATLDTAALEAVREWEFEPARLGTAPISSTIEVPVRFYLTR